ncbi:MAG: hypothetical protein N5P05_000392 [Chroococcopsis gigantea SAG 12.99]|jgi:Uma2 family endonuclease|nr:hypothetical protein [Chroococcopsis gigantea SAG 12.99]
MVQFIETVDTIDVDTLPDSDGLPVDNELHILLPNFLRSILSFIWCERLDWFMGVNMGIYHTTGERLRIPVVPDAFIALGVDRINDNKLRKSYITWKEKDIPPIFALEIVSQTPGDEYEEKMEIYRKLGVLYYVIYNPDYWLRDQHEPLEIYRLEDDVYQRQWGEPYWMPELGIAIGRGRGINDRINREWLYWFDGNGNRYESPEEKAQNLQNEKQELFDQNQFLIERNQILEEKLRQLNIDPDNLPQ